MSPDDGFLKELQTRLAEAKATWEAGETSLSGLSDDELRVLMGYVPGPGELSLKEREVRSTENRAALTAPTAGAPASWNWRDVGGRSFVTPIRNQGSCGSCVAFGVVAALESQARVAADVATGDPSSGVLPDLSEAHLFFCGAGSDKCDYGWYVSAALNYSRDTGVSTESCFPYKAKNQPCNLCSNWQDQVTKLGAYHTISSPADIKTWLATRGPLVATMSVYKDFTSYKKGVYTRQSDTYLGGHCVFCYGYDDSQNAWLCKNSWGTGWGESGFFRIAYGQCGIDAGMWALDSMSRIHPLYDDIFMRDGLKDVGQVPSPSSCWASPDIIPVGSTPVPDPTTYFRANYRLDVGQPVLQGQLNYLYVRGKNLYRDAAAGKIQLYYSPASLLLWPSKWSANALKTERGADFVDVTGPLQGDVVVGASPFTWTPAKLPSGEHYCLIARVETERHPNPVPADGSITDFARYVMYNPAVGWRNVAMITQDTPTVQVQVDLTVHEAVELYVGLTAVGLDGCSVQFTCGTAGPNPLITMNKTKVSGPSQFYGVLSKVPAGWGSLITVSYWNNGKKPEPGSTLKLVAFYPVEDEDHPLQPYAADLRALQPIPAHDAAGLAPTRAVMVGEFTIEIQ